MSQKDYNDTFTTDASGVNWYNPAVQCPRFLWEADAAGAFTPEVLAAMAASMDLQPWEVQWQIQRAIDMFESIKSGYRFKLTTVRLDTPENIEDVKFEPIPDYGDLMPLQEWIDGVECGGFIDYDGHGTLATADMNTCHSISPSDWSTDLKLPEWVTHIVWYNR